MLWILACRARRRCRTGSPQRCERPGDDTQRTREPTICTQVALLAESDAPDRRTLVWVSPVVSTLSGHSTRSTVPHWIRGETTLMLLTFFSLLTTATNRKQTAGGCA